MDDIEYRAQQAKRIVTDPLFVSAKGAVIAQLRDLVCTLPLEAREKREYALAILKGAEQFFRVFDLILADNEVHQNELLATEQARVRHERIQEQLNNV